MKMYNDSYLYPFPNPNYMNAQRNNYSSQSRNRIDYNANGQLRVYPIYAPPNHPYGIVHATKADAEESQGNRCRNGGMNRVTNSANVKTAFTIEEAAAIALLLGIDFNMTKFELNEFWMGVNTELEHGRKYNQTNVTADDPITTGKIALAHLSEFPDYYQRLKKLEEEAKAYWNK